MERFAHLFGELDASTRTGDKVAALVRYFTVAPPEDAAWALRFLSGRRPKRAVGARLLLQWAGELAEVPEWLTAECIDAVGDLAETIALLLPRPSGPQPPPLHRLVEDTILPLAGLDEPRKKDLVLATWRDLNTEQRLVWNKLITGEFRIGVARTLLIRAIAEVAGTTPAVIAHRLMGTWHPTAADYRRLMSGEEVSEPGRPYPFFLAHPLRDPPETLGPVADWQLEWKWDGIRCQCIHRSGDVVLWSRGEELVTDRFPEVSEAAAALPDGTVLDGEILAWDGSRPLPFAALQRRLGRIGVPAQLLRDVPVALMTYDILEEDAVDVRDLPLVQRRERLERLFASGLPAAFALSRIVSGSWTELTRERERSRELGVEGFMIKKRDSAYGVGRTVGTWWKWKIDPYHVDAVLIYAQQGHGRRAGLYTDYTFGVWSGDELVPVAKAYSGLTDEEIREVDRFVRDHTVDKFGPVRVVQPTLVFEIAFEAISASKRHKAGIAVRFPRMARWRRDKTAPDADTLDSLQALLRSVR